MTGAVGKMTLVLSRWLMLGSTAMALSGCVNAPYPAVPGAYPPVTPQYQARYPYQGTDPNYSLDVNIDPVPARQYRASIPAAPPLPVQRRFAFPVERPAIRAATPDDIRQIHALYRSGMAIVDATDAGQTNLDLNKAIADLGRASDLDKDVGPTDLHDSIQMGWAHAYGLQSRAQAPDSGPRFHFTPRCSDGVGTRYVLNCSEN